MERGRPLGHETVVYGLAVWTGPAGMAHGISQSGLVSHLGR